MNKYYYYITNNITHVYQLKSSFTPNNKYLFPKKINYKKFTLIELNEIKKNYILFQKNLIIFPKKLINYKKFTQCELNEIKKNYILFLKN